jgi:archaellum component FlaF (FlaF/FlaG flagellin family)
MAKKRTKKKAEKASKPVSEEPVAGGPVASEPMEVSEPEPASRQRGIGPLAGALIIALALVLVFSMLGQGGTSPSQPEVAAEEPAAPSAGAGHGVQSVAPETPPEEEPEQPPAEEPKVELLSGLKCSGDNVQGTITNVLDTQLLVEDIRVLFNGKVVEPVTLRCDKTVLEPGESTFCASLQGALPPASGENTVAVVVGEKSTTKKVNC